MSRRLCPSIWLFCCLSAALRLIATSFCCIVPSISPPSHAPV
uniref:Uncharacterized protein n=1 Tax=Cucumis melo TaxID=3656 RepID=A0A9I9EHH9_CUCME